MNASSPRWSLAPGVFYRLAGPHVYVRNVTTRYDYLFNPMVKDILDLLGTERTKDELLDILSAGLEKRIKAHTESRMDGFVESLKKRETDPYSLVAEIMDNLKSI